MEPPIRTPFTSWDGLEEEELSDIKSAIRDITNAKADIAQKQGIKRSSKKEQKKLEDEVSKLLAITREWARRPGPTTNQQPSLNDQDHAKFRKLYVLIQEGLQNPIRALDADFIEQLRDLCQVREEIGATDACEVEEAASESGEETDLMDVETAVMTDREKILEAASRIVISPAPSFGDMKELQDEEPTPEEMLEFAVDEATKEGFPWNEVQESEADREKERGESEEDSEGEYNPQGEEWSEDGSEEESEGDGEGGGEGEDNLQEEDFYYEDIV